MTVATTSSESRSRPPQSREINYEIERRFLVNYLPPELNLHAAKANNIMQAYLFASEDVEQRIRAENGVFFQTIKRGNGLKRQENDSRIPEQDFNMMLSLATEGTVEKTRYHLSYKSSIIYLDIYKGKCEGLTVAEVEFASEKAAYEFVPPEWFGREITGEKGYKNSQLAKHGLPLKAIARTEAESEKVSNIHRANLTEGVEMLVQLINTKVQDNTCPVVCLIAGGSASGKTSQVATRIREAFGGNATLLSMDDYYHGTYALSELKLNFDQPESQDIDLLAFHLRQLKAGKSIQKPVYDFKSGERVPGSLQTVEPKRVIILEGLFALDPRLAEIGDVNAFVDVGVHGRMMRRLFRDAERSSWKPVKTLRYMLNTVEPMYNKYIVPEMTRADLIIDNQYNAEREGIRAGMTETQLKFKGTVDSEKLRKLGAERLASAKQIDYYYLPLPANPNEVLRIREEGGKYILTYKGPVMESNAVKRSKFEFEIDKEIADQILSVYPKQISVVTKERTLYHLNGISFSIDEHVAEVGTWGNRRGLGDFVEVRLPSWEQEQMATEGIFSALNLDPSQAVRKPYSEM